MKGTTRQTLLHTKYISCGPHDFREENFLSFYHYKSMGAFIVSAWQPEFLTIAVMVLKSVKKFG